MKTNYRLALWAAIPLFVTLVSQPLLAQQATFRDLGAIAAANENFAGATAIADNGKLIGGYTRSNATPDGRGAALWRGGLYAHELPGFATQNLWGHVRAVGPDGDLAVGSTTKDNQPRPFFWTPALGVRELSLAPSFLGGEAMSSNDRGSKIVGYGNFMGLLWNRPVPLTEAMVWDAGQPTSLGFLGNGVWSRANDVSADGRVIVGESDLNTSLGEYVAVMWINGLGPLKVGDLPGGYKRSRAVAVSADGSTIAGWGSKQFHPFLHRMFRWTRTGGMVDIGIAPGHQLAEATAMTPDGSVIVGWGQVAGSANRMPVIWDATNGVRDLTVMLEASGVDLTPWRNQFGQLFMQATGVTADGKTICGFGNLGNNRRGWVATLP